MSMEELKAADQERIAVSQPIALLLQGNNNAHIRDIVPHVQPTNEVQTIMRNYVSKNTRVQYTNELVKLFLYLFDLDLEKYFHDWFVLQARVADDEDQKGTNKRKLLRELFKNSINHVSKTRCPLILEAVDFATFTEYVTTRKSRKNRSLSKSGYGGIHSALMFLHKASGFRTTEEFQKNISQFNRGMKRKVADEKARFGTSLDEGKKGMSISVYKLMCKKLMGMETEDSVFGHLFLILEWNLMARSKNITMLITEHVRWRDDCLFLFFGVTKNDQEGDLCDTPWHVYSNPQEPSICPVLALAKYVFSHPDQIGNKSFLFPGNDQYSRYDFCLRHIQIYCSNNIFKSSEIYIRFIKLFHRVIKDSLEEFEALGVTEHTLGSHSTRKGAITTVSSGCTVSPSMASICLRAGWSMGNVRDRYIHYEKAGDQFCGRSVTGISSIKKEFATSPVYWECNPQGKDAVLKVLEEKFIKSTDISPSSFHLLQSLFAALCYHREYLEEVLSPRNKLRASPLFNTCFVFEHRVLLHFHGMQQVEHHSSVESLHTP